MAFYNEKFIARLEISYYTQNGEIIKANPAGMEVSNLNDGFKSEEIVFVKDDPLIHIYYSIEGEFINFFKFTTLHDKVYSFGNDEFSEEAFYDILHVGALKEIEFIRGKFSGNFYLI